MTFDISKKANEVIGIDMDINKIEDFIIHYTHTNHVEVAVYEKELLKIGSISNVKESLTYQLYDYEIVIYFLIRCFV